MYIRLSVGEPNQDRLRALFDNRIFEALQLGPEMLQEYYSVEDRHVIAWIVVRGDDGKEKTHPVAAIAHRFESEGLASRVTF